MGMESDSWSGTVLVTMVKWVTSSSRRPAGGDLEISRHRFPGLQRAGLGARRRVAPGRCWMEKTTAAGLLPRLAMR